MSNPNSFEYKIHVAIDEKNITSDVRNIIKNMQHEFQDGMYKITFTGDYNKLLQELVNLKNKVPNIDLTKGIQFEFADTIRSETVEGKKLIEELTTHIINAVNKAVSSIENIRNEIAKTQKDLNKRRRDLANIFGGGDLEKATSYNVGLFKNIHPEEKEVEKARMIFQRIVNITGKSASQIKEILSDSMQNWETMGMGNVFDDIKPNKSFQQYLDGVNSMILKDENAIDELEKKIERLESPQVEVSGKLANNFIEDLQSQLDSMGELNVKVKPIVDKNTKLEISADNVDVKSEVKTFTQQDSEDATRNWITELEEIEAKAGETKTAIKNIWDFNKADSSIDLWGSELEKVESEIQEGLKETRTEVKRTDEEINSLIRATADSIKIQDGYFESLKEKAKQGKLSFEEVVAIIKEAESLSRQYKKHALDSPRDLEYHEFDDNWSKYGIKVNAGDVNSYGEALKRVYSLYTSVAKAIKNNNGWYGGEQWNNDDLEELRGTFQMLVEYLDDFGLSIDNIIKKTPRMNKEFKELVRTTVSEYSEYKKADESYDAESDQLDKENEILKKKLYLLHKISNVVTGGDKDPSPRSVHAEGVIGETWNFEQSDYEYGTIESHVRELCDTLGIEIPQAAHEAQAAIAEVTTATATPPDTSGEDKIQEKLKETGEQAKETTEAIKKVNDSFASNKKSNDNIDEIKQINEQLDIGHNKLKEIEKQQEINNHKINTINQAKENYHEYAGLDKTKALYDTGKLSAASKALKDFNTQLENRNEFQDKYNELVGIIENNYLGKYGVENEIYDSLDSFMSSNSSLKYLQLLSQNGIKGESSKKISNAFEDAVKYLKSEGRDVSKLISSGDVYGDDINSSLADEERELEQERTRLSEEREEHAKNIYQLQQKLLESSINQRDVDKEINDSQQIVTNQNKIQTEFHETAEKAKEVTEAINEEKQAEGQLITGYRAYNRTAGIMGEKGIGWFSDDPETMKTYVAQNPDRNVVKGQIDTSKFFKLDAQGAKATAITYLGDQSDEVSKKITEVYNKIQAIKKELAEKPSDALSEELKNLELEYDALSEDKSNMYGTHSSTQFAIRAKEAGYKGIEINNVVDDYNTKSGNTSTTIALFDNEALRETEDITSQIKGNVETTQQAFNKQSAINSHADCLLSREDINETETDIDILTNKLEELNEENRLVSESAETLGEKLREITTATSEGNADIQNIKDYYSPEIGDVFDKDTDIGKYYNYLVQNTDFGTTEEEVSAAYEQIAQKILDFQKEVTNIVRSKIESIIGGSNQEGIASDATAPLTESRPIISQLEKEAEVKRDDTAATNELIEAEKKLREETSKPIVNTTGAESPTTPLPPQVEEALVDNEAKVDEVVEAEKKKISELGTELSTDIPQAIDKKNEALDGEKNKVDTIVQAEIDKFGQLETKIKTDIPKAIEEKNKALEGERTKVGEVVKDEIEKFSELNDIINGVKTSVDAKNKSVDKAKNKDWKKNSKGKDSDDSDLDSESGDDVLPKTFVSNKTLTKYLAEVSSTFKNNPIELAIKLDKAALRAEVKKIAPDVAENFNKQFGTSITGRDVEKAYSDIIKENEARQKKQEADRKKAIKEQEAEQKALNKQLETEYKKSETQQANKWKAFLAEKKEYEKAQESEFNYIEKKEREKEREYAKEIAEEQKKRQKFQKDALSFINEGQKYDNQKQAEEETNRILEERNRIYDELIGKIQQYENMRIRIASGKMIAGDSETNAQMLEEDIWKLFGEYEKPHWQATKTKNYNYAISKFASIDEKAEEARVLKRSEEEYEKLSKAVKKYADAKVRIDTGNAWEGDLENLEEYRKEFLLLFKDLHDGDLGEFYNQELESKALKRLKNLDDEINEKRAKSKPKTDDSASKTRKATLDIYTNKQKEIAKYEEKIKDIQNRNIPNKDKEIQSYEDSIQAIKTEIAAMGELNITEEENLNIESKVAKARREYADQIRRANDSRDLSSGQKSVNDAKQEFIELLKKENELRAEAFHLEKTGNNNSERYSEIKKELDGIEKSKETYRDYLNTKSETTFINEKIKASEQQLAEMKSNINKKLAAEEESFQKKRIALAQQMTQWLSSNPIAKKKYGYLLEEDISKLNSSAKMTPEIFKEIEKGFKKVKLEATAAGDTGSDFFTILKQRWQSLGAYLSSFASFYQVVNQIKKMVSSLRDLDDALTEMRKVSDESVASLKAFQIESFDIANQVGSTAKVIQDSTADWMRLGESLEEAKESAKDASILLNVSEFSSIDEATTALVAMSQAYKDMDKIDIIDKLNNIGNNFSISTDQLATGLQNAAAVLKTQGNDIDKSIALLTAANSIVQDISKASTGIRTISLRIAGTQTAKEELEELGESVDDYIVQTQSKTQATIKAYTAVASNAGKGIDVLDANGNLRATYDILLDISKVYKEIQEEDKKAGTNRAKALVEYLAGKNRSNIAASVLENPELLEKVYEASQDSVGSALEENEKYLDSISGHIAKLQNQLQKLYSDTLSSGFIKWTLDLLTNFTKLVDQVGLFRTAIIGLVSVVGSKKLG